MTSIYIPIFFSKSPFKTPIFCAWNHLHPALFGFILLNSNTCRFKTPEKTSEKGAFLKVRPSEWAALQMDPWPSWDHPMVFCLGLVGKMVINGDLMMVNNGSGWWYTYPSEKYEFVNGKDDISYMKWKIKNIWNHQPEGDRSPKPCFDSAHSRSKGSTENLHGNW